MGSPSVLCHNHTVNRGDIFFNKKKITLHTAHQQIAQDKLRNVLQGSEKKSTFSPITVLVCAFYITYDPNVNIEQV